MAGSGAGGMIAGPGSKDNGGSAHCSAHGLLAYGAGSCVVVVDVRSMQLVVVLPMPSARTSPMLPAPFVTALQWIPECMSRDLTQEASTSHLRLAVGDRQGRVAIWDTAMKDIVIWLNLETEKGRLGIQDLCWVFGQPWLLAVIHGPSVLVIWDPQQARPIWKYDAGTEYLGCIRCDPFDARQVCVVGLKGLILSLLVQGVSDNDVSSKQHNVVVSEERNSGNLGGSSSGSTSAGAPALAAAPGAIAKAMFSPRTRGLLYLVFAREIIVFDLNFGMTLGTTPMARGVGKILDVLAVADHDILYCAHQDGKISGWIKREDRQAFSMSFTETLIPPMGSPVPAPTVLAVIHCPLQVQVQNIELEEESTPRLQLDSLPLPGSAPSPTGFIENAKDDLGGTELASSEGSLVEATFVSITDDGRLWQWVVASTLKLGPELSGVSPPEPKFKLELTMQLQLLPSAITTLAVPVPSLLGIVTGGSGAGAVAVPMVALATQGGTLELVDAAANAVTSSFAVHNSSVVRGVRWLGNTRLVSFSYTEVKGKGGGFVNRLVVTCVRSGQSKAFRELQKPERAPMRALRTSPSGRYLIVLFREAPAEVWLMSKVPSMLRSLALPFTVMEWALPPAPRSSAAHKVSVSARKPSLFYSTPPTIASTAASINAVTAAAQPPGTGPTEKSGGPGESETGESFAFALVNGSLGVFELRGKRVRDFRPRWPAASFVSSDVLVTAMAYRMPHVVMGDRMGNIRWWDVTSGLSSLFNTHRGGVRRIKFAPVTLGDPSRGRIAVLFNDHTFAVYDLDTQDPLANALVHPQLGGILVLELDWFPLRADKHEPLLLCIAGADGSFRLLEIYSTAKPAQGAIVRPSVWQRCRPMPLCSPALLPPPHAMAFRMLLQLGIKSSWFYVTPSTGVEIHLGTRGGDLRHFLLESSLPDIGETVAAEVLLKSLETYRRAGRLLDRERVAAYEAISSQGVAARAAFTAAHFGEYAEAVFWLQLPKALALLSIGSAGKNAFWKSANALPVRQQVQVAPREEEDEDSLRSILKAEVSRDSASNEQNLSSPEPSLSMIKLPFRSVDVVPCEQSAVTAAAQERITWHEKLTGPMATQKRVHEYVSVGDFESAVTLLLSTPPGDENFYLDALRAVSLASAVSPALHELAVKVVAANMVGRDDSLAGTHLLCAVGRYQEACSQLQDAGRWVDASTLAAAHLKGTDHARVLERWAEHVLADEHNLWRAMILYVAAGALSEALAALRNAQLPDSSALFLLACHEAKKYAMADRKSQMEPQETPEKMDAAHSHVLDLPGDLSKHTDGVVAVCEYFGQYQRMLAHTVTSISPVID